MVIQHLFQRFAKIYGIILLVLGILGFIPAFVNEEGLLFHFYKVNFPLNIIYLVTGMIAIVLSWAKKFYIRLFFQIIGFIFCILAALGFIYREGHVLGIIANNLFVTWFHLIIGIFALILGFGTDETQEKGT